MFELTRKYEFHAARKLTSLPESHPCSKMHGHTFSVIVKINGHLDSSKGWVVDFSDIDDIYHKNVQSLLDHTYLNDIDTYPILRQNILWFGYGINYYLI